MKCAVANLTGGIQMQRVANINCTLSIEIELDDSITANELCPYLKTKYTEVIKRALSSAQLPGDLTIGPTVSKVREVLSEREIEINKEQFNDEMLEAEQFSEALDAAVIRKYRDWPGTYEQVPIESVFAYGDKSLEQLNKVLFAGEARFCYRLHWGDEDYIATETVNNPTIVDAMWYLGAAMHFTGDLHHCFLEACNVCDEVPDDGITLIELRTGS